MENNSFEDMPEAVRGTVLAAGVATFLTLAIHKDQITQPIEDRLPEAVREAVLVTGAAIFLSLAILEYQDQIMEMSGQVTQAIKDAYGETSRKILDFLGDVKEKVMSLPLAVWIFILFILAGKFARILTDFFDFPKFCFIAFRNCCSLSIRSVHLAKTNILGLSRLNQNPKNNDEISYSNILTQK